MPPQSRPTYCSICNAQGLAQPILSPMTASFVSAGQSKAPRHPTEAIYAEPHLSWKCSRCGYTFIADDGRGAK